MVNCHGAYGLNVFFSGDNIAQEGGRDSPGVGVICSGEVDAYTAGGVEFGRFAPEFLGGHGGLGECPSCRLGVTGHDNGTV